MMNHNAVIIDKSDNVIVAIKALKKGDEAVYFAPDKKTITVIEDIPMFHKIAIKNIPNNSKVTKYGEYIGISTKEIKIGQHVHSHNCTSNDNFKNAEATTEITNEFKDTNINCTRTFMGYKRDDGKVGIRNHVLVLPTSICATDTCERIASSVKGCVTFNNQNGCSQVSFDQQLTIETIAGLAANPNIHSVLAVSLGCENCQNDIVVEAIKKLTNKKIDTLIIQQVEGSIKAVELGIDKAKALVLEASKCKREYIKLFNYLCIITFRPKIPIID